MTHNSEKKFYNVNINRMTKSFIADSGLLQIFSNFNYFIIFLFRSELIENNCILFLFTKDTPHNIFFQLQLCFSRKLLILHLQSFYC